MPNWNHLQPTHGIHRLSHVEQTWKCWKARETKKTHLSKKPFRFWREGFWCVLFVFDWRVIDICAWIHLQIWKKTWDAKPALKLGCDWLVANECFWRWPTWWWWWLQHPGRSDLPSNEKYWLGNWNLYLYLLNWKKTLPVASYNLVVLFMAPPVGFPKFDSFRQFVRYENAWLSQRRLQNCRFDEPHIQKNLIGKRH